MSTLSFSTWSTTEEFYSCGDVRSSPSRIFEWRGRYPERPRSPRKRPPRPGKLFAFDSRTGEKLSLASSNTCTVAEAKEELEGLVPLPAGRMRLSWNGFILNDDRTLMSYGIEQGQCLHLTRSSEAAPKTFTLTVHGLDTGPKPVLTKFTVPVNATKTVIQVKEQLTKLTGMAANSQRLTCRGRTLNNEMCLRDYGIQDESAPIQLLCCLDGSPALRANGSSSRPNTAMLERNAKLAISCAAVECCDFPVNVREVWPPGRRHRVRLTADRTVLAMKRQLARLSGVAVGEQLLLHQGRFLQDDLTANYYNIEMGDTIQLALVGGSRPVALPKPRAPRPERLRPAGQLALQVAETDGETATAAHFCSRRRTALRPDSPSSAAPLAQLLDAALAGPQGRAAAAAAAAVAATAPASVTAPVLTPPATALAAASTETAAGAAGDELPGLLEELEELEERPPPVIEGAEVHPAEAAVGAPCAEDGADGAVLEPGPAAVGAAGHGEHGPPAEDPGSRAEAAPPVSSGEGSPARRDGEA